MRFIAIALVVVAGGCRDQGLVGFSGEDASSGNGTGSTGMTAGAGSSGAPSAANTSSAGAGSSGTSSGGSITGGSSTGLVSQIAMPTFLLDAGEGEIFGPVAIAGGANPFGEPPGARLAYSRGDGGQAEILLLGFAGDGGPFLGPQLVALTTPGIWASIAGEGTVGALPPHVTVSDFQGSTALCWEDFGWTSNLYGGCFPDAGPVVLCSTVPGIERPFPPISFSWCGNDPHLVFNSSDGVTQLFLGSGGVWLYGADWGTDISGWASPWSSGTVAFVPLGSQVDGILFPAADSILWGAPSDAGLAVEPMSYFAGGYIPQQPPLPEVDTALPASGLFAATSDPRHQTLGVAELNGSAIRSILWNRELGLVSASVIQSPAVTDFPVAAANCPSGFGYFVMTQSGAVLFAEQAFTGGMPSSESLTLGGLDSAPTSMAAASNVDGGLFLAVSSPGQIAVYLVGCQ